MSNNQTSIEKLIEELCPDGVEFKEFGEVCELKRGQSITKKDIIVGGIPVIAWGQKPAYFHNKSNRIGETITVAGSGAYAGFVMYWNKPIYVSDAFSIKAKSDISIKFIYHFLLSIQYKIHDLKKGGGVPHVYTKDVEKIQIPIPPLPVQQEIVKILDTFTQLEAELEAELEARKKQYEYYRDELLSFEDEEVEWKELWSLTVKPLEYWSWASAVEFDGDVRYVRITDISDDGLLNNKGKSPSYYEDKYLLNQWDILFARSGATVWKTCRYVSSYWKSIFAGYLIRFIADNTQVLSSFVYHYTKTTYYNTFVEKNKSTWSQPNINAKQYSSFTMPIPYKNWKPDLERQQEIVKILDTFDALVNDISIGLPAEIEARRKQYEYYREKLLSFKNINPPESKNSENSNYTPDNNAPTVPMGVPLKYQGKSKRYRLSKKIEKAVKYGIIARLPNYTIAYKYY